MKNKKKIYLFGGLILAVLLTSFFVRAYPLMKKGYTPTIEEVGLARAKNLHLVDSPYLEGANHIALSSERIKEEGVYANTTNELTPFLYNKIFDYFGVSAELPMYVSVGVWAMVSALLFLLVWHLLGLKIALFFSVIEIFTPFVVRGVLCPGFYEFAVLFFTIGLMFYLWREKQTWQELILASIFMSLAFLSRNAFVISLGALFIYEIFKNKSFKRLLLLVIPFIIICSSFLYPNFQKGIGNSFLTSSAKSQTFDTLGHLFPDPYTYHYGKEDYLKSIEGTTEPEFVEYLEKYGYNTSFKAKILSYFNAAKYYPQRMVKIIIIGGPFFCLFMALGFIWLFNKKRKIFILFFTWISLWYIFYIVLQTSSWNHFLEIMFPLALATAIGFYWLLEYLLKAIDFKLLKGFLMCFFCIFLIGQLILSVKWMLYDQYNAGIDKVFQYAETLDQIEKENPGIFSEETIIAVGNYPSAVYELNFLTDKSYVYFAPDTIIRLFDENKLDATIEKIKITHFIGYGDELSWGLYQNEYNVLLP